MALLSNAGDHVPAIPSMEVVGKAESIAPAQTGAICVNVGVPIGFTVMVMVVVIVV